MSLENIAFDTPFTFDGENVHESPELHSPSVYIHELDENDSMSEPYIDGTGWEFVTGHSGQHGYTGAVMHPSENISSGMMKALHEKHGDNATYVVTEVINEDDMDDLVGWTVLVKQ